MTAGSPRKQTNGQTTGDIFELAKSVDLWKSLFGGSGLVAMELGCDYGDLASILAII